MFGIINLLLCFAKNVYPLGLIKSVFIILGFLGKTEKTPLLRGGHGAQPPVSRGMRRGGSGLAWAPGRGLFLYVA